MISNQLKCKLYNCTIAYNRVYLKYFDNDWMTWRYVANDVLPVKWEINIDEPPCMDPVEAGKMTARRIFELNGRTTLLCSGGIDSQVMVLCFHLAEVDFDVVIVDYCGYNQHDTDVAKQFCDGLGITPIVHKFDALRFLLSGEYLDYAKAHDIQSPQFCVHLKWYEEVYAITKCPLILGGNTFHTSMNDYKSSNIFGYYHGYNQLSYQRSSVPVIGSFLSFTPELAFSLWKNSCPMEGTNEFFSNRKVEFEIRWRMYERSGFSLIKPETKYTGFENIKTLVDSGQYPGFFEVAFRKPITTKPVDVDTMILMPDELRIKLKDALCRSPEDD